MSLITWSADFVPLAIAATYAAFSAVVGALFAKSRNR